MRNSTDKIAVIDIGSNSVRLFVFEITGKRAKQVLAEKVFCGLGRDLATTGKLNPESVALTHESLKSFRDILAQHDIANTYVIGTAALREASDSAEFVSDVEKNTGFKIKIIDGEEEARLAAMAILFHLPMANGVVADFGGGSLELAKIANGVVEKKLSLRLGAHYLKALQDQEAEITRRLEEAFTQNPAFFGADNLYVIGGSWRSLIKAWLSENGDGTVEIDGLSFDGADIVPFCAQLQNREPKELISRYHMEEPRARLMDVSALMLRKLIAAIDPGEVQVSAAGIRDGIIYDHIFNAAE